MQIRSLVHGLNGRLEGGGQERWCGREGGGRRRVVGVGEGGEGRHG